MELQEPLRDRVGRALYEEPGLDRDWYLLSEDRREPWRKDADRLIPIVHQDSAAIVSAINVLQTFIGCLDRGHPPRLEHYDAARKALADLTGGRISR